jgi:hypothetical protein
VLRITRSDDLVTRAEAALLCGVSPDAITNWVARGHLTVARREGRTPLFDLVELAKVEHKLAKHARRMSAAWPPPPVSVVALPAASRPAAAA